MSQELHPGLLCRWQGPSYLLDHIAFPRALAEAKLKVEQPELEPGTQPGLPLGRQGPKYLSTQNEH